MAGAHEHAEHAEEAEHAAGSNKKVALLISVLALFLAISEMLGKGAQTEGLDANIKASDTWAFYQAKTIRMTTLETAAQTLKADLPSVTDPAAREAKQKLVERWEKTAARYDSDPEKHEGRKELMEHARELEAERDVSLTKYHHYEIASAAIEIGIVLASASVITGMIALAWLAGGLGVVGLAVMALGYYAPHVLHLA